MGSNIKPYRFWVQKVIPLVYDDSLSYYETLCQLQQKINECIEYMDSLEEIAKDYTDKAIAENKEWVIEQNNILRNDYNNFTNTVNSLIAKQDIEIANFKIDVKKYVDAQDEILKHWVETQLEGISLSVFNPVQGKNTSASVAINDLYNLHLDDCLTCGEYDALELTCGQYDNKDNSCGDYDLHSKTLLA